MVKVREDMTGWVMSEHGVPDSRLTVVEQTEDYIRPDGRHEARWLCECSCEKHKEVIVAGYLLKSGGVRSCGCLQKESEIQNGKNTHQVNKYDLYGEYGIGWTNNTNQEFYFDLEDYELIKDYCWYEHYNQKTGYRRLKAWNPSTKKSIVMSHLMGYRKYDHENRNPLDNRKSNFRLATDAENARNRSLLTTNTSGVTGVGWHKSSQTWRARIMVDGKSISLGSFNNKDDAIRARLCAEAKYYGVFAPQKHLFKKYNVEFYLQQFEKIINPKNTKSGIAGVSLREDGVKWRAYIKLDDKRKNLGTFESKDEAIKARLQAEYEYLGESAPHKYLFEEYEINTKQNDLKKGD